MSVSEGSAEGGKALFDPSVVWEELARGGERIVLLVLDGLGGLPHPETGRSELQTARIPNLDAIAASAACGLSEPVAAGITPGSGPGHLGLFGYHPLRHRIGRGILSALGIDFPLQEGDLAARINFATVDEKGLVQDRRAGRIATDEARVLCDRIRESIMLGDDVELFLEPVREHRAVLVLRGHGLAGDLEDTDPQQTGAPPRPARARTKESERAASLIRSFVEQVGDLLGDEPRANSVLLRGFDVHRPLPSLEQRFGLTGICLAEYPMYRGVSRLMGLDVDDDAGDAQDIFRNRLPAVWSQAHDLVFVHFKQTDSRGEDGDFDAKVAALEEVDGLIPSLLDLDPRVLVVAGDHSTPSRMASHSWHPVPLLIRAETARVDGVQCFDELACASGSLGRRPALDVMGLALAHAGRLEKYGA